MLALFPAMRYKAWYALGELVDNAIQSYISNRSALHATSSSYKLRVEVEFEQDRIIVRDNAAGIRTEDVGRAFAPASPPPDRTGLSQYGIGMKSAACWYAQRFSVQTTALGESVGRRVIVDIPEVLKSRSDEVAVEERDARPHEHGTILTLDRLNQPVPTGRTLGKIRKYLSSIYRSFLRDGSLELIVGQQSLTYREPEVLNAVRWDSADPRKFVWEKRVDILLPSVGKRITGWVAIRETGSTQEAGLALLHRGKVVVGAGSMAQDSDGSYRPEEIFGRANSFAYQRLFGELDVSDLAVAYSKDDVLWSGQEEVFVEALKIELDAEPMPLIRMANNYRKAEHRRRADTSADEVKRAVAAAASAAASTSGANPNRPPSDEPARRNSSSAPVSAVDPAPVSVDFNLPLEYDSSVRLTVVYDSSDNRLLSLHKSDERDVITVNRAAPFMASFASLPDGDIEPILRLCVAIALAEIQARLAGQTNASSFRNKLNELLQGPLSKKIEEV